MKLKRSLIALAAGAALSLPAVASAQNIGHGRNFGIGLVAGYPGFGFSMNIFLNNNMSLQIDPQLFAWKGDFWLGGRVDLLFYPGRPIVSKPAFDLRWYVGPGLGIGFNFDRSYLSLVPEVPVGIGFHFRRVPIDLMFEAVPQLWIATSSNRGGHDGLFFNVTGAVHARYYF